MNEQDTYKVTLEMRIEGHLCADITVEVSDSSTTAEVRTDGNSATPLVMDMVCSIAAFAVTKDKRLESLLTLIFAERGMMPFGFRGSDLDLPPEPDASSRSN